MKNIAIILCMFLSVTASDGKAQTFTKKSAFVSGIMGGARISNAGDGGETPVAITFGGSFGFPITKNLFIYTRGAYTSKSNFQSYYNTSYITSQIQFSDQFVEVNSSFSQLLFNGGLLYNFYLSDEFTIGLSTGVTFSVVNQEAKLIGGHVISIIDNEAIWGYFGGVLLEKSWEDSDVTTFVEAQYNYAQSDAPYHASALNTMNFTFGVRYYLSNRSF